MNPFEEEFSKYMHQLRYVKLELINNEHVVTLQDPKGYEIVKGYGTTVIEAINDLHNGLF